MAFEQAGLLELGEDPVYGGKADIHFLLNQQPVYVFRRKMPFVRMLEQIEDLQAG